MIEAVAEDEDVKKSVFRRLDQVRCVVVCLIVRRDVSNYLSSRKEVWQCLPGVVGRVGLGARKMHDLCEQKNILLQPSVKLQAPAYPFHYTSSSLHTAQQLLCTMRTLNKGSLHQPLPTALHRSRPSKRTSPPTRPASPSHDWPTSPPSLTEWCAAFLLLQSSLVCAVAAATWPDKSNHRAAEKTQLYNAACTAVCLQTSTFTRKYVLITHKQAAPSLALYPCQAGSKLAPLSTVFCGIRHSTGRHALHSPRARGLCGGAGQGHAHLVS